MASRATEVIPTTVGHRTIVALPRPEDRSILADIPVIEDRAIMLVVHIIMGHLLLLVVAEAAPLRTFVTMEASTTLAQMTPIRRRT